MFGLKAKSAAAGRAAPVSAVWSVELFGFKDIPLHYRSCISFHSIPLHYRSCISISFHYYINILYTVIDTMAKRQTGKRSVKRAFKKRRTIRKFRKTMRRYMQSGGIDNPAIGIIMGIAFAIVLDNSPKLKALLSLLGMRELEESNKTGGAGFFGINLTSARDAASSIVSKAQTKTIAVSKDTVVKSLNKLKAAFNADPSVDNITKTNITRCVGQLVDKINQAPASASAPENVTSEDITDSVSNADDTTPAPQGEQFVDMVKRVLALKIVSLKTKYETAIDARIQSFKTKYNLGNDDMNCINVLKAAVLDDLINKKNSLIDEIMKNRQVIAAIEKAKKAADIASAGTQYLKGKMDTVLQQNPKLAAAASAVKDTGTAAASEAASKFTGKLGTVLGQNQTAAAAASAVKDTAASALTNLTSGFSWGRK
jgi:hypothetical protein